MGSRIDQNYEIVDWDGLTDHLVVKVGRFYSLREMSTKKQAEEYVCNYFRDKRGIELQPVKRPETGFDFRNADSTLLVEVKGTAATDLPKVLFRYFTNAEFEAAKRSMQDGTIYEIHLVVGAGSAAPQHFLIPGQRLVESGKAETWWALSLTKDFQRYRV